MEFDCYSFESKETGNRPVQWYNNKNITHANSFFTKISLKNIQIKWDRSCKISGPKCLKFQIPREMQNLEGWCGKIIERDS